MKLLCQRPFAFILATGLTFGSAAGVRAEDSEIAAIRAQNELLQAQMQKHADEIQALKDQNAELRAAVERSPQVASASAATPLPAGKSSSDWQINGHFLLRHYYYDYSSDPRGMDQHSNSPTQYRALLTVARNVNNAFGATVQFGTGSGGPRGLESTLGGGPDFDTDPVYINQAYVTWTPALADDRLQLAVKAGKTPNPFTWDSVTGTGLMASDLVYWDGTFRQEGAYVASKYELSESTTLHGVLSAFVVDANAAAKDPRLYAGQIATTHQLLPDVQIGVRGSWYEWRALDSDFIGRATSGGNLISSIDGDEQTRIAELGSFALWSRQSDWPVRLYASVSRNLAANATVIGSTAVGKEDDAWTAGLELGTPKLLLLGVSYAAIEANSVLANFKDGIPTDGFTNRKEWHLYAARSLMPGVTLAVDLFSSDAIRDDGAFSGCAVGACGPFETSISNSDRTLAMTNLIFDF